MNSTQLVQAALNFKTPEYVPLYDQFWGGFLSKWREDQGLPPRVGIPSEDIVYYDSDIQSYFHIDLVKLIPNEDPWPSLKEELKREEGFIYERDGWGRIVRRRETSPYGLALEVSLEEKVGLDQLEFESPIQDGRFAAFQEYLGLAQSMEHRPFLFTKIGGPYLRSSFLRGEFQWFLDIAEDPVFAAELATKVTDHLIAVGLEALRRGKPSVRSIWIFDDLASNKGMLISPRSYEQLFLPQVRRMIRAFKEAGAETVGFHSDGDIRSVLDTLIEAGISLLNPVEPRANMDVVALRKRYGRELNLVGGLCNTLILPGGSDREVERHVEHVLSADDGGGLVVGSHSISNEIPLERYRFVMKILEKHGRPSPGWLGL